MEFPYGRVDEYTFNIIIENLIDHFDGQVWDTGILEEMVAVCSDPNVAIPTVEQAYTNFNGIRSPLITTKGWGVQFKWRDQSTDWVPLHLINESNLI